MARETRPLFVLVGMALSATAAISAEPTECGRQVANAYAKLQATQVFQFEDGFSAPKWGESSRWIAFDIPRAAHRIDTRTVRGRTTKSEIIAIGPKAWTNDGQGWKETAGPGTVTFGWDRIFKMHRDHEVLQFSRAECLGEMTVDGQDAIAYQAKTSVDVVSDHGRTVETVCHRFYMAKDSGLPLGLGSCEMPSTLGIRFRYHAGIKIEPPSSGK